MEWECCNRLSEMDDLSDSLVAICTQSLLSGYEGDVEPLSQLPRSDEFDNQVFLKLPVMLRIVALCIKVMPL